MLSRLSGLAPTESLSTLMKRCSLKRGTNHCRKFDPMKPAPPVTRILIHLSRDSLRLDQGTTDERMGSTFAAGRRQAARTIRLDATTMYWLSRARSAIEIA